MGVSRPARRQLLLLAVLASAGLIGCDRKARKDTRRPPRPEAVGQAEKMLAGVVRAEGGEIDVPYRLFVPPSYDPQRSYPLVLFLHSAAARGEDNVRHLTFDLIQWTTKAQTVEPAFILAPHCPRRKQWVQAVRGRPFKNYQQSEVPENDIGRAVLQVVGETQKKYNIDPRRLYITGPSMGGVATWDFITRHPGRFAAAVPITGVNDPSRAPVIADLPIWTFHGARDPANPVANTRAMVNALRKSGSSVRYTEYPDAEHNCWNQAYATEELYRWLFAQRLGQPDTWDNRERL